MANEFEKDVKRFHGQVKISDVHKAFDNILTRIHDMEDVYNASLNLSEGIDYTKGGATLAPLGYSLSVGGLKDLLKTYDGVVIGSKCIKVSSNKVALTDGILITKDGGVRLPESTVDIASNTKTIYYDKVLERYVTSPNSNTVKVCDINTNRKSNFLSTINNVQLEDLDGYYAIGTESRTFKDFAGGSPMSIDTTNKPQFFCAIDRIRLEGDGTASVNLFGEQVAKNRMTGHKNLNYWVNVNFLYIPKGCSNPYSVNKDASKVFEVIEKKDLNLNLE